MPQFKLGWEKTELVKVRRNNVFFACLFLLPERVKETLPYELVSQIEGDIVMGFYCDSVPGDIVNYSAFKWKVFGRTHYPVRRNSNKTKRIAELILEYIGEIDK